MMQYPPQHGPICAGKCIEISPSVAWLLLERPVDGLRARPSKSRKLIRLMSGFNPSHAAATASAPIFSSATNTLKSSLETSIVIKLSLSERLSYRSG
jgi:hypothetical protein